MKRLLFHVNLGLRISNFGMKHQLISPKWKILCFLITLLCLVSVSSADDGLIGKWRAVDENSIIYGLGYIPELKFAQDGTLYTGIAYGYEIIDDGKFMWDFGNGVKKIYKYQIWGDLLLIYSLEASDDRARFYRVR
jgi:hypothetical protein